MKRWRRLKRAGVRRPRLVIKEARRADLRVADALAMLQNETGIPQRNVFGCDWGSQDGKPPFCGDRVTRRRVKRLLRSGKANGVGVTQLTYPPFVWEAERLGGANRVRNQLRVGFRVLKDNINRLGRVGGFKAYNGTGPPADAYAARALARSQGWQDVLDGKQKSRPA